MRLPRFHLRTLMIIIALVALLITGWRLLDGDSATRRKVNYCRGAAAAHRGLAVHFQKELADPSRPPAEIAALKRAIRLQWIIVRKYKAVAADPSLPYPSAPFVTPAELDPELSPSSSE